MANPEGDLGGPTQGQASPKRAAGGGQVNDLAEDRRRETGGRGRKQHPGKRLTRDDPVRHPIRTGTKPGFTALPLIVDGLPDEQVPSYLGR